MNNPPSLFRSLPTSLKLRRTGRLDKITNFLCLSLLLLGATALGMDPSFASSLASRGQVNPDEQLGRQLIEAARDGDIKEVKRLIREGASVEAKHNDGWTPLMYAALAGHEDVCKLLIENKALVEAKEDDEGWTPLIFAAQYGHGDVCKLLVANKALIEAKDDDGWTPFIVAAKYGHEAVCRFLIANKALVQEEDKYGWTPLVYAGEYGREDVCKLLINVQLEQAKAAIVAFLGIVKKRRDKLPCHMHYDVAKIVARQVFQLAMRPVTEQIKKINDPVNHAKWLAYANEQINSVNK